jgi:glutathione S-transferase
LREPYREAQDERSHQLEDWFDEELGPYIRRFAFHELRRDRDLFAEVAEDSAPPWALPFRRAGVAYGRAFTGARFLAASDRAAERARERVLAGLDRLEAELGSNDYLVGDGFSVADLTAAALFYPLALPPEGAGPLPTAGDVPPLPGVAARAPRSPVGPGDLPPPPPPSRARSR